MLNKREKLFVILLTVFCPLIHEIGHFIGYTLDGIPAKLVSL